MLGSWKNAQGQSFFEVMPVTTKPGIYCYYNITGIPGGISHPASNFVRIIKLVEAAIVIMNRQMFFIESQNNSWSTTWTKVTTTSVSSE